MSNNYYNQDAREQYGHNTYVPPQDERYRHDMAVARYDDDRTRYEDDRSRYDDRDRGYASRTGDRGGYYDDRRSEDDDRDYDTYSRSRKRSSSRPRSRDTHDSKLERKGDHHKEKEIGATVIGGAIGAFAGNKLGHNGLASTIGALAGAYGAHELEKRHEKHRDRRGEEQKDYEHNSRRSSSRPRSSRGDDLSDTEFDDRRQRQNYGRDSGRYD